MAKVARKAAVRKAPKAASPAIKPVKQTLTKSELINLIAEENEIPRKTAAGVYATLEIVRMVVARVFDIEGIRLDGREST